MENEKKNEICISRQSKTTALDLHIKKKTAASADRVDLGLQNKRILGGECKNSGGTKGANSEHKQCVRHPLLVQRAKYIYT